MLLSKEMIFSPKEKLCPWRQGFSYTQKELKNMRGRYIDEYNKKEKLKENKIQKVIESHKCNNCVWGTWTGSKYLCMFYRCQK